MNLSTGEYSVALWLLCHLLQYLVLDAEENGGVEQLEESFLARLRQVFYRALAISRQNALV